MKCEFPGAKCECKKCLLFNNSYCNYTKSNAVCDSCSWLGPMKKCRHKNNKKKNKKSIISFIIDFVKIILNKKEND